MFLTSPEPKRLLLKGGAGKLFQLFSGKVKNHHLMFPVLKPKQLRKIYLRRSENPENDFEKAKSQTPGFIQEDQALYEVKPARKKASIGGTDHERPL